MSSMVIAYKWMVLLWYFLHIPMKVNADKLSGGGNSCENDVKRLFHDNGSSKGCYI